MLKFVYCFIFAAVVLICSADTILASHPKTPHGFWSGKVVSITQSAIVLSDVESWEYGSDSKQISRKAETFNPRKPAFTIDERAVGDQDLSSHFKVGDIVTLRWMDEENRRNHIF